MSKIISKEQIKEALDNSIEGVLETPGYMEKFAREIEKAVIETLVKQAIAHAKAGVPDSKGELEERIEPVAWRWPVPKLRGCEWRYSKHKTRDNAEPLYTTSPDAEIQLLKLRGKSE